MIPVQYLARMLELPLPQQEALNRPVSALAGVQPVHNATERDQTAPRPAFEHLAIGQVLTGLVKSQSKGISLVEVEGQTIAMRLPHEAAPGDTLRLRFAGHMPQPVFLLESPEAAASNAPQLSQTARMLSDIMQRVPERSAPTLTPPQPLLQQPPASAPELMLALRTALVRSGLFYESHLADWAVGQDSLDGLLQEPQNRLAREASSSASVLALPDAKTAEKPANPLHTLLTQQLQVLETPNFIWKGELWPGQPLEWQIRQDEGAPHHGSESAAPAAGEANGGWESHLKLTLPQLGTVDVHIKLDARQAFSIRMVPESARTAPLLEKNQTRLIEQLAAAGCTLQTLTVERDAGE